MSGTKSKPNRVSLEVDGGSVGMALAASCCWLRLRFASRCTAAAGASGLRPLDGLGCLVLGTADTELDAGRPIEKAGGYSCIFRHDMLFKAFLPSTSIPFNPFLRIGLQGPKKAIFL